MKHRLSALSSLGRVSLLRTQHPRLLGSNYIQIPRQHGATAKPFHGRFFTITSHLRQEDPRLREFNNSNARPASELNDNITQEEKDHFARKLEEDKGKQIRTPWHREGSDQPPVARQRSAGAMTKGISRFDVSLLLDPYDRCRQTSHDTLSYAQNHPTAHYQRHQL